MQNKFVKQDTKFLSKIKKSIKNEIKKRGFEFNNEVYNIKHLTECPRRIVYRVNGSKCSNGSLSSETNYENKFWASQSLQYTKKKWLKILDNCFGVNVVEKFVVAADSNYNISGTVDAIIRCEDYVGALIIDELENDEYIKAENQGGLRRQIIEVMSAAWLTEVSHGILICENRNTNDYFMSHVIPHELVLNGIKNKFKELMKRKIFQTELPDRPYKNENNKECNICEYKDLCWAITK